MTFALYRLFTFLIYLLVYPFARVRAAQGSRLWAGRLGLSANLGVADIWMHAASVGEAKVICYLVDYLKSKDPSLLIHVTTMTSTGHAAAQQQCTLDGVSFSFFPIDTSGAVERTLAALSPRMIVVAETEIWPCLVEAASARKIPIVLTNARMSERAYNRYRHVSAFIGSLLSKYDRFFFKTADDAGRFAQLGASGTQGEVAGDMKFDAPMVRRTPEMVRMIRDNYNIPGDAFVIVAGSTRPGEEAILADVFQQLSREFQNAYLILAPRHIERSEEVGTLLSSKGLAYRLQNSPTAGERIMLVNRLGLLNELYLAASVSFVGGTLVDIGGHNLLEPVWAGSPVLFGPSLSNVKAAAEYIVKHNYGGLVNDSKELYSVLKKIRTSDILYATKKTNSPDNSATAVVGDYILSKLTHV